MTRNIQFFRQLIRLDANVKIDFVPKDFIADIFI